MTPAEKAKDLVGRYLIMDTHDEDPFIIRKQRAKQCALIAVEEIKEQLISNLSNDISGIHAIYCGKVKQEIEKL